MTVKADSQTLPFHRIVERWVAGVSFIALGIVLACAAFRDKGFTAEGFFALRLLAAIFAMAIGSYLGGMASIEINIRGIAIRAIGAATFFVLVWLVNPPQLVAHRVGADGDYDKATNLEIIALMKRGKYEEAERSVRTALRKYPDSGRLNYNLACVLSAIAKNNPTVSSSKDDLLDEAVKALEQAIRHNALTILQIDEQVSNPVDFVLKDEDLSLLFVKRPHVRTFVEGYRTDFAPVMGTKSYSGGGCFAGDTPILLQSGLTSPIRSIVVGDSVRDKKRGAFSQVTKVGSTFAEVVVINDSLCVSKTQPLMLDGGSWCQAGELHCGHRLSQVNGSLAVRTIVRGPLQRVFWLEVEPHHQYLAADVLAHNKLIPAD